MQPQHQKRQTIRLKEYDYQQPGLYFITICCYQKSRLFGQLINGKVILNDAGKIANQCWLNIPIHFPDVILHEFIIMPDHIHGIIELTVGAKNFSPYKRIPQPSSPDIPRSDTSSPDKRIPQPPPPDIPKEKRLIQQGKKYYGNIESANNNDYVNRLGNDGVYRDGNDGVNRDGNDDGVYRVGNDDGVYRVGNDDGVYRVGNDGVYRDGNDGVNRVGNDGVYRAKNFSPLRSPSKTIGSVVRGFKIGVTKWFRQNTQIQNVWQRNYYEHIIRDKKSYQNITNYIINNPKNG
jgi:REP element-mobilizing transposase RayT